MTTNGNVIYSNMDTYFTHFPLHVHMMGVHITLRSQGGILYRHNKVRIIDQKQLTFALPSFVVEQYWWRCKQHQCWWYFWISWCNKVLVLWWWCSANFAGIGPFHFLCFRGGGGGGAMVVLTLQSPFSEIKLSQYIYNCYFKSHNSHIQQRAKEGGTVL
jgi:hypothetical protein